MADAYNHGIRWGIPHRTGKVKKQLSLSRTLATYGQTESFWDKKLEDVIDQQKSGKTKVSCGFSYFFCIVFSTRRFKATASRFQYDLDFSEGYTSGSYDVEDDLELHPISKIPYFCLVPPEIPNGRFVWNCPGCEYHIDLLNPSPDILDHLPDDTKQVISGKGGILKTNLSNFSSSRLSLIIIKINIFPVMSYMNQIGRQIVVLVPGEEELLNTNQITEFLSF
jgi:hypothetical protein